MSPETQNANLAQAREAKEDEFYTQLPDIEKELRHYRKHFKGKTVYCNCDDPRVSNFFHYFSHNFEKLGLKRLITTCYQNKDMDLFSRKDSKQAIRLEYTGDKNKNRIPDIDEIGVQTLKGDGDFRSEESIDLLKQSDIVVTNPPFSLFREYVNQLLKYEKQFLIIGSKNAISYKDIFPHIMKNRIWVGYNSGDMAFMVPSSYEPRETRFWIDESGQKWRSLGNSCWFTNLDISKRHDDLILYKKYSPKEYPSYDNYDAIEVSHYKDIPEDYFDPMGVPITFIENHNPDQFEILGVTQSWSDGRTKEYPEQIQVNADGKTSRVRKLNDGAAIKVTTPPNKKTYYRVDHEYYVKVYARLLIKRK